jgi:hypothetical protein
MNILDTRDLNNRLEELDTLKSALQIARDELAEAGEDNPDREELEAALQDAEDCFSDDEAAELEELEAMRDEISEWRHGEALIPVSDWEEYVEELLQDCGDLPRDLPWYIVIDWEKTANNISADYSVIDYQGETYYYRNC